MCQTESGLFPVTGSSPVTWGLVLRGSCVSEIMLEGLPWYGTTELSVCPHNLLCL